MADPSGDTKAIGDVHESSLATGGSEFLSQCVQKWTGVGRIGGRSHRSLF